MTKGLLEAYCVQIVLVSFAELWLIGYCNCILSADNPFDNLHHCPASSVPFSYQGLE